MPPLNVKHWRCPVFPPPPRDTCCIRTWLYRTGCYGQETFIAYFRYVLCRNKLAGFRRKYLNTSIHLFLSRSLLTNCCSPPTLTPLQLTSFRDLGPEDGLRMRWDYQTHPVYTGRWYFRSSAVKSNKSTIRSTHQTSGDSIRNGAVLAELHNVLKNQKWKQI